MLSFFFAENRKTVPGSSGKYPGRQIYCKRGKYLQGDHKVHNRNPSKGLRKSTSSVKCLQYSKGLRSGLEVNVKILGWSQYKPEFRGDFVSILIFLQINLDNSA